MDDGINIATTSNHHIVQRDSRRNYIQIINSLGYLPLKMATGGDLTLADREIEDLAQIIVMKHMATIAINYLELPYETVENLKLIRQNDYVAFNRDLLVLWRNKNPGIDQVQVSQKVQVIQSKFVS